MRHMLSLRDWTREDLYELFERTSGYVAEVGKQFDGAVAMFFPASSLRTRFAFERGAAQMGLQPILFPPECLDKPEDLIDVVGYLAQWASLAVVRHPDIAVLERMAVANALPVVNAMTEVNHPCEVLSDLYALSREVNALEVRYLFVGADGNIARAWWEASQAFDLDIRQSCPAALRVSGMPWEEDLRQAITTADVVITDGPGIHAEELTAYRMTAALLEGGPSGIRLAPCPPFVRGREVSADAIDHPAFVGYGFKRYLKPVQQAVMSLAIAP
ncbi:hypothetical protein [Natronoglycomyces albus]|uniref:Aspartate/ornithine carbamoyltransferase carbamoyl-P binding domain-containing protein n=1 Tax=Natronoglycomyces albus TaxID=2811108 RepID=A0A895XNI5_9ACTN|nr:hypothetical protein [Natronoglycomyces albus]QSB04615.1 hypothetical protein JQS30_12650 [Natronoglycomyces albus]